MNTTTRTELQELKCRKCNLVKPITDFVRDKNKLLGYRRLCKKCMCQEIKEIENDRRSKGMCVRCGKTAKKNSVLCIGCSEKDTKRMLLKRRENKIKAVKYLGGICQKCGIKSKILAIYDFHHKDKNKEVGIALILNKSFERIKLELDKCKLVCANCHRIIHAEEENGKQFQRDKKGDYCWI